MPTRRYMLAFCGRSMAILATGPLFTFISAGASAQVPRGPVLEQRLLTGLRVKTDSDREFIQTVVQLVEKRQLPVRLVDTTYFWARAKATNKRSLANNPMVYFRPALTARAARLGIHL